MFFFLRVRKAKLEGVSVVDVDGTYYERKRQKLLSSGVNPAPLPLPDVPLHGWVDTSLSEDTKMLDSTFPCVLPSTLYTYLAEGTGHTKGNKAFRALKRGYLNFASCRIKKIEYQNRHPSYTFIRSSITLSMKPGLYKLMLLLQKESVKEQCIGKIVHARCECAAG